MTAKHSSMIVFSVEKGFDVIIYCLTTTLANGHERDNKVGVLFHWHPEPDENTFLFVIPVKPCTAPVTTVFRVLSSVD